ncbi:hypothetical protein [Candidatus Tisiphia endosymbiont of Hybos culiciformis]|uniref:hypothetical protein n=1 Tax=Candidatus Tisiphia endosymbiont of Hybos culiciformis TaxID=3139331 RepID=UPI003CCACBF7
MSKLNIKTKAKAANKLETKQKCQLCGSTTKPLTTTDCCNNLLCDDAHTYVVFSYAKNSCYRNHDRYTLCSSHYQDNHQGKWQDCKKCKADFNEVDYVEMATNRYNFKTEALKGLARVTIICVNCQFKSDKMDDFAFRTSQGFYCSKKECQKVVF